ncbi:MAG: hypothetical protein J7J07_06325 [Syntrophobacterales bacterium]|nr:hypothetical protein [Syntrophobacterales bacterium]
MKDKLLNMIPVRNLLYLVICIVVIGGFILLIIYPSYKSLNRLETEIANIEQRIDTQKTLLPLYMKLIKKSEAMVPAMFSLPEKKKLTDNNLDLIPSVFKEIASESGTRIVSVKPDFTTLARNKETILINATVRGNFFNFRKFLIELGKISYMKQIEEIRIQQRTADKEFNLKIWLRVG